MSVAAYRIHLERREPSISTKHPDSTTERSSMTIGAAEYKIELVDDREDSRSLSTLRMSAKAHAVDDDTNPQRPPSSPIEEFATPERKLSSPPSGHRTRSQSSSLPTLKLASTATMIDNRDRSSSAPAHNYCSGEDEVDELDDDPLLRLDCKYFSCFRTSFRLCRRASRLTCAHLTSCS